LAARGSPRELAAELLDAAIQMLGGSGGLVSRFDQAHGRLIPACQQPDTGKPLPLAPRRGASSQAVQRRAPVILDDYQPKRRTGSRSSGTHIRASIAVPLLYEGRVLGALEVQTSDPGRRFSDEDANGLELLAGVATAMLVGLQQAWLEGIRLTLRTVQHHVNNDLTITSGYAEFLALDASLPTELRQAATKVQQGARAAASILNELEPSNRLQADVWSRPTPTAIRVGPWAAGQPARVHRSATGGGGVPSVRRASTM
jgi:GAF domain-containing protein